MRPLPPATKPYGKPSRADFLLQPGELLAACAGLRVVAYEDGYLRRAAALRAAHRGRPGRPTGRLATAAALTAARVPHMGVS
jgi:hypothetical protein